MKLILGAPPCVCLLEYLGGGGGSPNRDISSWESGTAESLQLLRGKRGVLRPPPAPRRSQPGAQAGKDRGPARLVRCWLTALSALCISRRVFHVESVL